MDYVFDLTAHETTRLAAVLAACADTYDPVEILAGEQEALRLLYTDLSPEQEAIYGQLVAAGVL